MRRRVYCFLWALPFLAGVSYAEDWPAWRGPRGDGSSVETGVPIRWSATENVYWKVPIPGLGHSSPIVVGDRIFLTSCVPERGERLLICLDRKSGKTLWSRIVLSAPLERKHPLNSHASSTPACDGNRVFSTFVDAPRMRVYAHDLAGNEVWEASPGEFHSVHGYCSSIVPYEDTIIVNGDQDAEAFIVALDRTSGKERWRIQRPNVMRSYCTPTIFETRDRTQMVLSGNICVASYDPGTGKLWWILDGPTDQMVASVVHARDVFFVTGGFPELHILGLPTDRSGKLTKDDILWSSNEGVSYVPSPIAHEDHFFVVSDKGIASCFEAKTGNVLWKKRMGGRHSASLVKAEGRVYFLSDEGECWVVKAGPTYEEVAINRLGEACNASPAISRGQIFLRTDRHLCAIGEPRE